MEPLSIRPAKPAPNEPHNLLARLYREIGVSAVAAALEVSDVVGNVEPVESVASSDMALLAATPADKAA